MAPSIPPTSASRVTTKRQNKLHRQEASYYSKSHSAPHSSAENANNSLSDDIENQKGKHLHPLKISGEVVGTTAQKEKSKVVTSKPLKGRRHKVPESEVIERDAKDPIAKEVNCEKDENANKTTHTSEDTAMGSKLKQSTEMRIASTTSVQEKETRRAPSTQKESRMLRDRVEKAKELESQLDDSKSDSEPIDYDEDGPLVAATHASKSSLPSSSAEEEPREGSSTVKDRLSRTNERKEQKNTALQASENVTKRGALTTGYDLSRQKKATSGVVYISRIPPGMDVGALRALLSRAGQLGRVWLRPESAEAHAERRALGSSRRRGEFMDGWVEFVKRGEAKRAVGLLNGRPMSGTRRRGRWADDLWCMRFLKDYTWRDLVEETCGGGRERTLKVKAEVAAARRERNFVEERVALARKIGEGGGEREGVRRFRQKRIISEREWEEDVDERRAREAMQRVDAEMESGKGRDVDTELMGMLFKKRKKG